jgi:cytochrome c-type biogenesis protein
MDWLLSLYESSQMPVLSAFLLGLMTAISPCPLATNITAIGFISKNIDNRWRVFVNGLIYTLGRGIAYFLIAFIFFLGADQFSFSGPIQQWGEKLLGPLLVIIGLFMLDFIKIPFPFLSRIGKGMENRSQKGYWGVLLLGFVFALAFCPYSGVLYFGILIPMTISSAGGLYLPLVFALATGIPVIIIAWLIAFSFGKIGNFYNRLKTFEIWFRRVVSVLFIVVGIYLIIQTIF